MKMTKAEDLKCGDCFTFRGEPYVALSQFSDNRHSQTILTAVRGEDYDTPLSVADGVVVMRLVRTFEVGVTGRTTLSLTVVELTDEEVRNLPTPKIGAF